MPTNKLKTLIEQSEAFTSLDGHFADLIVELEGQSSEELWFAAAIASQQTRQKHICVDLSRFGEREFWYAVFGEETPTDIPVTKKVAPVLRQAQIVGRPGDRHPLILEGDRLYLYRYWQYEQHLAQAIRKRARTTDVPDTAKMKAGLQRYFEHITEDGVDWQQVAAITALSKRFCVISGGPGTGKTRTIGIILALLIEQTETDPPVIKLAAPTGKAAVRLQESIKKLKDEDRFPDDIRALIPEEASTLHRLLGYKKFSPYFRHDASNPLDADIVVVDEASMVAQPLLAKLMLALPERARLILLGDQSQLASVETGSALADICDAGKGLFSDDMGQIIRTLTGFEIDSETATDKQSDMSDCVVVLKKNYRFEGHGILELSHAVNAGEVEHAMKTLQDAKTPDVSWRSLNMIQLKKNILNWISDYSMSLKPEEVFRQFDRFRILCALRHGPQGITQINALVDQFVRRKTGVSSNSDWYAGQPVLITRNDYNLNLFNGDVGIILPDPDANDELRAYFPVPDDSFRKVRPFRLPEYELAYAMTVHKSQGSEFENVMLVLPEQDSPILTRELIYTGITRATKRVEIWGSEDVFQVAVSRRIRRSSGLREALLKNRDSA